MNFVIIILALQIALTLCNSLIATAVMFAIIVGLAIFYMKRTDNKRLQCQNNGFVYKHAKPYNIFVFSFLIILGFTLVYWLANYPGGFNLDALGQWEQAHRTFYFDDWHPLFSTLLIQLSISICDSFVFYIFVQIVCFSLSVSVLLYQLNMFGVTKTAIVICAVLIGINPAIALNTISMTKDAQFTIFLVIMFCFIINLYFSQGSWLCKWRNIIFFSIVGTILCLVRHNGCLFVVPLYLIVLKIGWKFKKQCFVTILLTVCCIVGFKGPVYRALDVKAHANVIGESVGIPMSIIVNSFLTDEQNFPEETHAFLNNIASDDEWKEYYILGEWDSCKWEFGGTQLLKDSHLSDIIKHTILAIKHNPEAAFESFRENTRLVWEPIYTKEYWVPDVYVENNSYGIPNEPLHNMEKLQTWLINASLSFPANIILWNTGFQLFVILIACLLLNYRSMEFKLMLVLPLLFFDIGTMLLLAGPNQRYFYCNAVLFLPILLALLPQKER